MEENVIKLTTKNENLGYHVNVKAAAKGTAEIFIYDVIGETWQGGISAKRFAEDLRGLGKLDQIDVRINSDGGDVFDGKTIYSLLKQHPANVTVYVDGLAASIASLIAMAGDEIVMADGAMMMIHKAWGVTVGNEEDMRQQADVLAMVDNTLLKTYCARTGMSSTKCLNMMKKETWMDSDICVKEGFADRIMDKLKIAASVRDLIQAKDGRIVPVGERFKNLPRNLKPLPPRMRAAMDENMQLRKLFNTSSSLGVK